MKGLVDELPCGFLILLHKNSPESFLFCMKMPPVITDGLFSVRPGFVRKSTAMAYFFKASAH